MNDRLLQKIIAKSEYKKGKTFLQNLEQRNQKDKTYLLWAACLAVLISLTFGITSFFYKQDTTQTLFAKHFKPYENVIAPISRNKNTQNTQERAFYYYETKQYNNALVTFDSLITTNPKNKTIYNFYKANIFLQQNTNTEKAIKILKHNSESSNYWKDKNLWFLALAYLKNNNKDLAIKTLEKVNTNFKKKQRLKLLKTLK